jgi:glycosyltransferase involved in cell wall biosynthesis/nucleoside-diphosphate-sugar epimerase
VARIALVGHTGFIGGSILGLETSHQFICIGLPHIVATERNPSGAINEWCEQNLACWSQLQRDLVGCDAVINAAGAADPDSSDEAALYSANLALPAIVGAAAVAAGVKRLVHISTAAVQGPGPLDETARHDTFSPYSESKAAAERYLLSPGADVPEEVVIYRPTSVMAAGRDTTRRLRRRCSGRVPVISLDAPLPLAHVDNVADAAVFLAAVANPPHIVTHPDEGVTVSDIVRWSGGTPVRVPRSVASAGLDFLRGVSTLIPSVAGPARRLDLFLRGQAVDARRLRDLGWVPWRHKESLPQLFAPPVVDGPLRIAFLITRSDTVGGAHVHVRDLARSLLDLGHQVQVFIGSDGPYGDMLRGNGIPAVSVRSLVRRLDLRADRRACAELASSLGDFRPQVLSTHSSKAGVIGRIVGRRLHIPTLFTAHGWAFTEGIALRERIGYGVVELLAAPLAVTIVCVSEHDRALARRHFIDRLTTIRTVPNAVRDVPRELRADPGRISPQLIMVARLDDQKCQHEVLQALHRLRDSEFSMVFVGDGPKRDELVALAGHLGLAARCSFLGLRRDVEVQLAASQIFVLMSNYEGMPRSILEAMRAGLPVVASRTAGIPEIVEHGRTGLLVEPHDVEALTAALGHLLMDADLRRQLGRAGRERYEERYELSRLVREMTEIYRTVAATRS